MSQTARAQKFLQLLDRMKATTTGVTTGTGIVNYNLEPGAKMLTPVITPLRNSIPRVISENGDTGVKWKAITAINPGRTPATMREGRRSGYIDQTEADYSQNFATIGLENFITEQAILAAKGFDNALSIMQLNLLNSTMIAEEQLDLGGNQSYAFGTTATPAGTLAAGGTLTSGTALVCKAVALTLEGYKQAVQNGQVVQTVTRTNGDGTSDVINMGSAILSAASASATPSAGNLSIVWKVAAKKGAFGYAWFVGTASGSCYFQGVTSINQFTQTSQIATGQLDGTLTATDYSANPYAYDGLVTIAAQAGAYTSLDGATLTADGFGGVYEIDAFLAAFYNSRKVSPTAMYMSANTKKSISRKIQSGPNGSGVGTFKIEVSSNGGQTDLQGGTIVNTYNNTFAPNGNVALPMIVHPDMPDGKIYFDCDNIPYAIQNAPVARRKLLRRDYWSVLWPQVTMNRQVGDYFDGLMQVYVPFALGVLDNFSLN